MSKGGLKPFAIISIIIIYYINKKKQMKRREDKERIAQLYIVN